MLEWAQEHNLVINPGKGIETWVDCVVGTGCCPVIRTRPCPCPESINEVADDGCCAGRLYWRDYMAFAETYRAALREWQRKKEEEGEVAKQVDEELAMALVSLGYKTKEARKIAQNCPDGLELEEKVKWALKQATAQKEA